MTQSEFDELIRKYPHLKSNDHSHDQKRRQHSQLQKQEENFRIETDPTKIVARNSHSDHKPRRAKNKQPDHPKYRVTIIWRVSDKRRRDNDGMLATVMDCLVHATRRLVGLDSVKRAKRGVRQKG